MTLAQLEAIYKANISCGHLEALEAVYTQGYYAGAGQSVGSTTPPSVVGAQAAPSTIVSIRHPDLR